MSMRAGLIALLLATCISSQVSQAAAASCEAEITDAAKAYDIPVGILYSVGLTETGMRGSLQPFALNIEGKAYFARSKSEAVQVLNDALAQGKVLVIGTSSPRSMPCSIRMPMFAMPRDFCMS
jgi:hypothetical protein